MDDPDATDAVQVQFSIDDGPVGAAIADRLLADRLVACVQQLGPITSRYRWQGQVEVTQEWLFVAKTSRSAADAVVHRIAQEHPYDVPEVLVTDVVGGLARYLDWIADEVADEDGA